MQRNNEGKQLRRFALRFIHSHSGATGVFLQICRFVYFRCAASQSDRREQQDRRLRAESGGFTNKNISTLCITMSSIHSLFSVGRDQRPIKPATA